MAESTPKPEKIRCDACPVMCYIADGKAGACDRYANEAGHYDEVLDFLKRHGK